MKNQNIMKYSMGFMIINLLICYNLAISQEVVINSGMTIFSNGTLSFSNGTSLNIKTIDANNSFGGTVIFTGSQSQKISSPSTVKFINLVLENSSLLTLENNIEIFKDLRLNRGVLNILNNNVLIKKGALIDGIIANKSMIATELNGKVIWEVSKIGKYFIPIGDISGTSADFTPINLDFKSAKFASNATVSVSVKNAKHPLNKYTTNYLKRYWTIQQTGITSFSCNTTLYYVTSDISGIETSINGAQLLTNNTWKLLNKVTGSSLNASLSSFGDFTGLPKSGPTTKSISEDIEIIISENGISILPQEFVRLKKIEIYNKVGQIVYSKMLEPNSSPELPLSLNTDIYLVKVITDKNVITKKVFLQ